MSVCLSVSCETMVLSRILYIRLFLVALIREKIFSYSYKDFLFSFFLSVCPSVCPFRVRLWCFDQEENIYPYKDFLFSFQLSPSSCLCVRLFVRSVSLIGLCWSRRPTCTTPTSQSATTSANRTSSR